jgi:cell wall-associated NlpC family hydrolase
MADLIASVAITPVMRDPNPRAELVSQMVLGETAALLEQAGDWLHLRRDQDGYSGWSHRGYLKMATEAEVESWRRRSGFRGEDARLIDEGGKRLALPLLARVAAASEGWELPSGWRGRLESGAIHSAQELARSARSERPIDWAAAHFTGSPYLWGGITPWGADCSGMVQSAYAARDILLPRDSAEQAECGAAVAIEAAKPGDLLFFSEAGDRITHVAFLGDGDTLVHSTIACGGFLTETWSPGSRASRLREKLVTVRRVEDR